MKPSAIVVGAGIAGFAIGRALALKGYKVDVFERHTFSAGASVRNFGMVWPIGQPDGPMYGRALKGRSIWLELCREAGIWNEPKGSLHLAYSDLEMEVLQIFYEQVKANRPYRLATADELCKRFPAIVPLGLKGGLLSSDEVIIDAPAAIAAMPHFLQEKFGVNFHWQQHVNEAGSNFIRSGAKTFEADEIYICNGADYENLFPELFEAEEITKCKLQMMKTAPQPGGWRLGVAVGGGLSLIHYQSFHVAAAQIRRLKAEYEQSFAEYLQWGIHAMVSQNSSGEVLIGDSHEYAADHDPFVKEHINRLILGYLSRMLRLPCVELSASWYGIYSKLKNGESFLLRRPAPGVTVFNGLGGSGMTLAFALAEELTV